MLWWGDFAGVSFSMTYFFDFFKLVWMGVSEPPFFDKLIDCMICGVWNLRVKNEKFTTKWTFSKLHEKIWKSNQFLLKKPNENFSTPKFINHPHWIHLYSSISSSENGGFSKTSLNSSWSDSYWLCLFDKDLCNLSILLLSVAPKSNILQGMHGQV